MTWRSPISGATLAADTPHSLAAAGERWPVVGGIPYLRIGREALVAETLARLDAGDGEGALVVLLADQDDWWTGPATDPSELRALVAGRDTLSLRAAMALLRFGPVADYFAYRWSDPTYLAALALLEAHWNAPATAFELACGIGHYLRELTRRGVACLGSDVVFAKCWLAKHWVAPGAGYVVFDAGGRWPIAGRTFDLTQCHDAFYFMPDQPHVAAMLRSMVAADGVLAISHAHNGGVAGGPKGPARTAAEWGALFPKALVYDERDLLAALIGRDAPEPIGWVDDPMIEAYSFVEGVTAPVARLGGGIGVPPEGAELRPNPLLNGDAICWPSARYREEYEAHSTWTIESHDSARTRRLVDLPARW